MTIEEALTVLFTLAAMAVLVMLYRARENILKAVLYPLILPFIGLGATIAAIIGYSRYARVERRRARRYNRDQPPRSALTPSSPSNDSR